MTREEKKKKRILRAKLRRNRRMDKYIQRIRDARHAGLPRWIPLSAAQGGYSWADPNSSTGASQVCDYFGICEFPCNGDC